MELVLGVHVCVRGIQSLQASCVRRDGEQTPAVANGEAFIHVNSSNIVGDARCRNNCRLAAYTSWPRWAPDTPERGTTILCSVAVSMALQALTNYQRCAIYLFICQ